jgi:hypothetical protein
MKGKKLPVLVLVLVLVVCALPVFAREIMFIDVAEAYILEGPGTEYGIISRVTPDEPLTLISVQGDWFEIMRGDGLVGWIHRVVLSPEISERYPGEFHGVDSNSLGSSPGESSGSFLDTIKPGFKGSDDYSITGSAGTRGIDVVEEGGNYGRDYSAVEYMESFYIPPYQIEEFIETGGLNR